MRDTPSPNYNERKGPVSFLILHYTGTSQADEAGRIYLDKQRDPVAGPVSPHYMIDQKGEVSRFVPEEKRAWHAGRSYWAGETDMNSRSIGIELVNQGEYAGYPEFTERQINSLIALSKEICARHDIPASHILGHSDISPGRKLDPGPAFPWKKLAEKGIGLWPEPEEEDFNTAFEILKKHKADKALYDVLVRIGYDPECEEAALRQSFESHYFPGGAMDKMVLALALALEKHPAINIS